MSGVPEVLGELFAASPVLQKMVAEQRGKSKAQLFGTVLEFERRHELITRAELAHRIGARETDVEKMEAGELIPDGDHWARIKANLRRMRPYQQLRLQAQMEGKGWRSTHAQPEEPKVMATTTKRESTPEERLNWCRQRMTLHPKMPLRQVMDECKARFGRGVMFYSVRDLRDEITQDSQEVEAPYQEEPRPEPPPIVTQPPAAVLPETPVVPIVPRPPAPPVLAPPRARPTTRRTPSRPPPGSSWTPSRVSRASPCASRRGRRSSSTSARWWNPGPSR